jgi:hypothetical protein
LTAPELETALREINQTVKVRRDGKAREWIASIEWREPSQRELSRVEGSAKDEHYPAKDRIHAALEAAVLAYWRRK